MLFLTAFIVSQTPAHGPSYAVVAVLGTAFAALLSFLFKMHGEGTRERKETRTEHRKERDQMGERLEKTVHTFERGIKEIVEEFKGR